MKAIFVYVIRIFIVVWVKVGRGDNTQLFISPVLEYEGWWYNVMDDKNFEIDSQEPPWGYQEFTCPIETCRKCKNMRISILFWLWYKCVLSRPTPCPVEPIAHMKTQFIIKNMPLRMRAVVRGTKLSVNLVSNDWNTFDHYQNIIKISSFFLSHRTMYKIRTPGCCDLMQNFYTHYIIKSSYRYII